jgi:hypothetical protein
LRHDQEGDRLRCLDRCGLNPRLRCHFHPWCEPGLWS